MDLDGREGQLPGLSVAPSPATPYGGDPRASRDRLDSSQLPRCRTPAPRLPPDSAVISLKGIFLYIYMKPPQNSRQNFATRLPPNRVPSLTAANPVSPQSRGGGGPFLARALHRGSQATGRQGHASCAAAAFRLPLRTLGCSLLWGQMSTGLRGHCEVPHARGPVCRRRFRLPSLLAPASQRVAPLSWARRAARPGSLPAPPWDAAAPPPRLGWAPSCSAARTPPPARRCPPDTSSLLPRPAGSPVQDRHPPPGPRAAESWSDRPDH